MCSWALLLEGPGLELEGSRTGASKQSLQQGWVSLLLALVQPPPQGLSLLSQGERVVKRQPDVDQYLTLQGPFLCTLQQVQSHHSKEVSEPSLFLQIDLLTWQRAGD